MISQFQGWEGEDGFGSMQGFGSIPSPVSQTGERVLQVVISCLFICHPQLSTPDYSCHRSVVYPLPYLFFSPSLPPPGFCLGCCTISAFPNLRKMQIKSFTVLKPPFFSPFFFLLQISGSFIPQWKPLCCLCHRSLFKFRGVMSIRKIKEFWSRNLLITAASSLRLV